MHSTRFLESITRDRNHPRGTCVVANCTSIPAAAPLPDAEVGDHLGRHSDETTRAHQPAAEPAEAADVEVLAHEVDDPALHDVGAVHLHHACAAVGSRRGKKECTGKSTSAMEVSRK